MCRHHLLPLLLLALPAAPRAAEAWQERPDWARFFAEAGVAGTIAVLDERSGTASVHDRARAERRFPAASTFKIPHALFALDAGLVRDEFQVFPWDGQKRWLEAWNRDQTLRSSMRHSVVWVYQEWARKMGERRERTNLRKIGYGNAEIGGAVDAFWLDGSLRISALEQIAFLRRLHRNELPYRVQDQRLVKDVLVLEAGRDFILRAKTGWYGREKPGTGWWVGWVEWPEGAVFFALNVDLPREEADLPAREAVGRAVLRSVGALP